MQKSTYMPKAGDEDPQWHLVDLEGVILGRAATRIANLLRGKHKPTFTPHHDMGDFVVAINAEKVKLTGNKLQDKLYYRHSGYPGGIKSSSAGEILEKKPEELIRSAVNGMLPKNGSRKHYLKKLKIYAGTEHPHEAQNPEAIGLNDKEVTTKLKPAKAAPKKTEAKVEEPQKAEKKAEAKAEAPKKTEAKTAAKAPAKKAPAKKPAAAKTEKKPAKKPEKKES